MNQRWFRALFRRRFIVALLLVLQALFWGYYIFVRSQASVIVNRLLTLLSILAAIHVVAKRDKGAFKTTWVFLILSLPLFGGVLYILFNFQTTTRRFVKSIQEIEKKAKPLFSLPGDAYETVKDTLGHSFPQVRYLQDCIGFPIYDHTQTKYLSPGEAMLEALLPELEKAEHYIFLEFFIVQEGVMWGSILDVLKRKAAQGVTVRLIYDDMGCFFVLPKDYPQQLAKHGIACMLFNPFRPFLTAKQNNRDHRKIVVIDGKVAFTGGINLADEYINAREKYGHWKDAAVKLEGKAAWSFTLMFLEMWELCSGKKEDYGIYYPWMEGSCDIPSDGLVQPYADSPMDRENVGEHVYLQILSQAQDYVYINTPYLIIDDSVISALTLAAKRGVDVRIVTPHRWDKFIVHMTTRSYYRELVNAGVKVYEYTDGFIHSKTFVCDDHIGTVGTTNLDFRSLYLHFECGVLMFGSTAVRELKADFLNTLPVCQEITQKDCKANYIKQAFQDILRLFAPLM